MYNNARLYLPMSRKKNVFLCLTTSSTADIKCGYQVESVVTVVTACHTSAKSCYSPRPALLCFFRPVLLLKRLQLLFPTLLLSFLSSVDQYFSCAIARLSLDTHRLMDTAETHYLCLPSQFQAFSFASNVVSYRLRIFWVSKWSSGKFDFIQ